MGDQAPPTTEELSDKQQIVLHVLQICSSSLSMIGSSMVVLKIVRDWAQIRSTTPYERVILGLSCSDILSSISYAIGPFLLPSDTSSHVWAFGSRASCQAFGCFFQLSVFWAFWCNCILSYYFLLTVLSQLRQKNLVRRYEPWMHLSGIYFLITAIVGYRREWYGEVELGMYCWITDPITKWIFGGAIAGFTTLSLIVNYSMIYVVVHRSLHSSEQIASLTSAQERIKREAMTLMFLYVGIYLALTTPLAFVEILESIFGFTSKDKIKLYPLLVVNSLLLPLQGFCNVFIYLRPTYTRFRAANPDKAMRFVLHQALFNPNVPQLASSSGHSANSAITEADTANPNRALFNSNFRPHSSSSDSSSSSE